MIRRDICAALSKYMDRDAARMEIAVKHQEDTSSERYTTTLYAKLPVHSMRLKDFLTMLLITTLKIQFPDLIYVILLSGIGLWQSGARQTRTVP